MSITTAGLRAIVVCVDYSDFLSITLPRNRHHFGEVCVVTSMRDILSGRVAEEHGAQVYRTDAFYYGGAKFNKWLALENALDTYGRHGWLCILDADVIWPHRLPEFDLLPGKLYTPYRRMMPIPPIVYGAPTEFTIPDETLWSRFPLHRVRSDFSGYTQIFHASDPVLGSPPWHETDWVHAGGGDTMLQAKWSKANKIRPPFEVLHLGDAGVNWCGRTTRFLDGSLPEQADERRRALAGYMRLRQRRGDYRHEKLP